MGAFVCRECARTWPDWRNQEYDYDPGSLKSGPDQGLCHECAEEEDDEPENPWSRIHGQVSRVS